MVGKPVRRRAFWVVAAASAALMVYLVFAVFGVHTLFYDEETNEGFAADPASGELAEISSGRFHAVAHPGAGRATVHRLGEGSYTLRLESLDVFNGPDLYVYAVAAGDATDDAAVTDSGFLDLGPLKGNRGNQTYELPESFDPDKHRAISIWCKRFSVNFATAPLR